MRPFYLDRRMLKNMDWLLNFCLFFIIVFSIAMVYSASRAEIEGDPYYYIERHTAFMVAGFIAFGFGLLLDYSFLQHFHKSIYVGMMLSLLAVFLIGDEGIYGAVRWINLGPISIQPSEWSKIFLTLSLANLLAKQEETHSLKPFVLALAAMALPTVAVVSSDLGTATVLVVLTMGVLFLYGTPWRYMLAVVAAGLASLPLLWSRLGEFQQARLIVFLELAGYVQQPSAAQTSAWQLLQSLIAVGSGGLWGAGYLGGTQTQLSFLPETHTDFIFATIAEELGFFGATILVVTYLIMIWRIFSIASTARDQYGKLVAGGVGFTLLYHLLVNVGMTLGLMPVTGIPLPLVSYGTNSLIATMLGLGIVNSIALRRTKSIF